jgi:hypothetical protein
MARKLLIRNGVTASESGAPAHLRAHSTQGASATGAAQTVTGLTELLLGTWTSDVADDTPTIAGNISMNIWGSESANGVNARFRADFHVYRGGAEQARFATGAMSAELTTTNAARTWTITPTSTALQAGDRLIIKIYAQHNDGVSAMGTGTVTLRYNGAAAADGDSFATLTEDVRMRRIRTVKAASGDYTTLTGWEAGEQGNLTTLNDLAYCELYAIDDTTQCTLDGWTTDSTRYIRIYTDSSARHAGIWDDTKYNLVLTTAGSPGGCIANKEDYTRIEYLQVHNTHGTPGDFDCAIYSENIMLVDGCIGRGGKWTVDTSAGTSLTEELNSLRNSLFYGGARGGRIKGTAGGRSRAYNCTFIGSVYGLDTSASTNYPIAKNVYAHGGTAGFTANGGANLVTKTNVMSSDATATNNAGGGGVTNCTDNVAHNTTQFTNVTGGSENYLLPSGSALIDAGVDLSGVFTNDIDGTTRTGTFDVGADEFVAAAGGNRRRRVLLCGSR